MNIKKIKIMELKKVNVAPTSTAGHFVEKANNVVNLDNINDTYLVEGKSILTTKNHTTLKQDFELCLITTQQVFNPYSKMFEKSID